MVLWSLLSSSWTLLLYYYHYYCINFIFLIITSLQHCFTNISPTSYISFFHHLFIQDTSQKTTKTVGRRPRRCRWQSQQRATTILTSCCIKWFKNRRKLFENVGGCTYKVSMTYPLNTSYPIIWMLLLTNSLNASYHTLWTPLRHLTHPLNTPINAPLTHLLPNIPSINLITPGNSNPSSPLFLFSLFVMTGTILDEMLCRLQLETAMSQCWS